MADDGDDDKKDAGDANDEEEDADANDEEEDASDANDEEEDADADLLRSEKSRHLIGCRDSVDVEQVQRGRG